MGSTAIFRVQLQDGSRRTATGPIDEGPTALLNPSVTVDSLLAEGAGSLGDVEEMPVEPLARPFELLTPLQGQPVWASGVTYQRSRQAREEESDTPDHYERVYGADRPELFVKALPGCTVGPGEAIGIRTDSAWNVPEPELGIVVDPTGAIEALTIGNDVSSRSIEGENPLYLPQAKTYHRSCAIGPALVPIADDWSHEQLTVELEIERDGAVEFADAISVGQMKRSPRDLAKWLMRCQEHPVGVVLLTGTGIVPPSSFTLREGDRVRIAITDLGVLTNTVTEVN